MTFLRKALVVATLGSLVVGGSLLQAQPKDEDKKEKKDKGETPEVTAPISTESSLTPGEMQAESELKIDGMQEVLRRIVELQRVARKAKDVIKLNCVNDKLLQVKQLLNIADASRNNMVEAIELQDDEGTLHQYSQITITSEQSDALRNEAEGCIGEELIFLGPTEVTVDDPGLPDDPTADPPFNWYDIIEPPGYASPFL